MPATKEPTTVMDAVTLDGGLGATRESGYVDLRTAYGGAWHVKVVNGSTRLAKGVVVQGMVSPDQVDGNEHPFDCRKVCGQEADEVTKFVIQIPIGTNFTLLDIVESDEDAEITAVFVKVTGL